MKGDPVFVILKHTAWMQVGLENSILGAIVKNPLSPSTDHVPDSPLQHSNYDVLETIGHEFTLTNNVEDTLNVDGSVSKIANFTVKGRREDSIHLQGKLVRVKRIQQVSKFWDALRSDPTVASTVPRWISYFNTWPVCLVAGIMICEDVDHTRNIDSSAKVGASAELPVSAIAGAGGVPLPLGSAADPKLVAEKNREASTSFQANYEGGHIFAVELLKVTTGMIHRKELRLRDEGPDGIDPARLAGVGSDEDEDEHDELDKPVEPSDLICVDIDPRDLNDMAR